LVHLRLGLLFAVAALLALQSAGSASAAGNTITNIPYVGKLALDSTGFPVIAAQTATGLAIYHCNDANCTGNDESTTTPDGTPNADPYAMTLDAAGYPVVAYGAPTDVFVLHCDDPDCAAGGDSIQMIGSGSDASLALDTSGYPVLAYSAGQNMNLVHCTDADCAGGKSTTSFSLGGSSVTALPSLKLDAAGDPVVSYDRGEILWLLHCNDASCSGGDESNFQLEFLAPAAWSSLDLDSSGNPVVAFAGAPSAYDAAHLIIIHCNDPDCTGNDESRAYGVPQTIGAPPSLTLDTAGFPVVAYGLGINLLRCDDPYCVGGGDRHATVDLATGFSVSLVLDGSGYPVVTSISNPASGPIKRHLLRCGDPNCYIPPAPPDTDHDGCPDPAEQSSNPAYGGMRDYTNPYDYFNPSHDGQNRIDDVLLVVYAYFKDDSDGNPGLPPYAAGYNPDTDRTLLGPNAWNLGPPNGLQRVDDILNIVHQYFDDCS
jgi:hypothetical protein